MWLSFSKNGIRYSNQISTTAPIFLQFNYFRQNLEENVTFIFYFLSFASNFPCKILWDNKNIDANILIFQIQFSQCWGPRRKKIFRDFFLSIKESACVPNLKFLRHPQQVFFVNNCIISDKYVMGIFFLQILSSFWPVSAGIIIFWSKLHKN